MSRGRLYDTERHAVLAAVYAREGTAVCQEDVGAYRTKVVRAGDMLYISCYPLISNRELLRQQDLRLEAMRQAKLPRRMRAAWNKYNNARRTREFEQLVHANFGQGDLHISLTYDMTAWYDRGEKAEPITEDDAKRHVRNYLARVKRLVKRNGGDPDGIRWIQVTVCREAQHESSVPQQDRIHHHMLLHGVPESLRNEAEALWPFGYCNADRLREDSRGLAAMAGYIARQEGSANGTSYKRHSYTCSRNIRRPEIRTSDARISRRRVGQIAQDVRANGADILEKIYPGYRLTDEAEVYISDYTAGAYIYARMRRWGAPDGLQAYFKGRGGIRKNDP